MRKRWRKRYCVLSNGILYLYEQQKSDGTEKTCSTVNLKFFGECVKAPRKECKKSPNTLILEPTKKKEDSTESTKSSNKIIREFFYTETSDEQEAWLSKLQESLSMANIGGNSKLQHVTKTRARPPRGGAGGKRRPPTKQHLKERALMSEVSLDNQETEQVSNGPVKKRGNIPTSALRPPPSGSKPMTPKSPIEVKPKDFIEANGEVKTGDLNEANGEVKTGDLHEANGEVKTDDLNEAYGEEKNVPGGDSPLKTPPIRSPMSPKPPPAALKPPSMKRVEVVRNDSTSSGGSHKSLPSIRDSTISNESLPPPPVSPPVEEDEPIPDENEEKSSQSSSKSSSLSRKENGSIKSISDPGSPPLPPSPLLDTNANVDENHNDEGVVEESNISPTKLEKLKDSFISDILNDPTLTRDKILKARSMMDLDRDSGDEEPLPPPPNPPPAEEETNGGIHIEEVKKDAKKKKNKGAKKTRPASLVLDI